mgnify:CR=1 FL=1
MTPLSSHDLNKLLFESTEDNFDAFLKRQEDAVKKEMRELSGIKDDSRIKKIVGRLRQFLTTLNEEELTEESYKDQVYGLIIGTLKLPEAMLKIFDLGVNFISYIPAVLAGYYKRDKSNFDTISLEDTFRVFLVATVGTGAANHFIDTFSFEDGQVTTAMKFLWGMAFIIGALRGALKFKLDTAFFIRGLRHKLNVNKDEPTDIEATPSVKQPYVKLPNS